MDTAGQQTERAERGSGTVTSHMARPRVLVADDSDEMCDLLAWMLREAGADVDICHDGCSALQRLSDGAADSSAGSGPGYNLAVMDIRMPGMTALEVLQHLGRQENRPPVILITAFGDRETHRVARELGAVAVLDKPFELDAFEAIAADVLGIGTDQDM